MRKIIDGRTYNTETSAELGRQRSPEGSRDFRYCDEGLFRNSKGAYFLCGEGGPMSKYAVSTDINSWRGGSDIIPLTADEAREWAEKYLDAAEYESIFGAAEEADPEGTSDGLRTRERVNLTLDTDMMSSLRKLSKDSGIPMSTMVDRAVKAMYGDKLAKYRNEDMSVYLDADE